MEVIERWSSCVQELLIESGEWTHMQLAAFIEAADKDEALYDGLANTVMVQHFAVNTDAAMAQDGIESCETFKRLIKVLEVCCGDSKGPCAIIVADPTLRIAKPNALREVEKDPS